MDQRHILSVVFNNLKRSCFQQWSKKCITVYIQQQYSRNFYILHILLEQHILIYIHSQLCIYLSFTNSEKINHFVGWHLNVIKVDKVQIFLTICASQHVMVYNAMNFSCYQTTIKIISSKFPPGDTVVVNGKARVNYHLGEIENE